MTGGRLEQKLLGMINGYWVSQAIYAAATFGIADHLKDGPMSVDDLAEATSTDPGALYRLLRALASQGIFAEESPRSFALTPLADLLRSDVPGSKRSLALMAGDEHFQAWSEIEYSIRTGKKAFDKVFGQPVFEYLADHPDKAKIFDDAMVNIHGREAEYIVDAYDFNGIGLLADIGGGSGTQLATILGRYPQMRGILFDMPHVVERAESSIEGAGVADRCRPVGGDFFQAVPEGADAYIMRHIIHDWDDEKARIILRNCHRAMPSHGKVLIVETVIRPGNDPCSAKLLDLVMLLIPGGLERTEEEYRTLLDESGFELARIVPTAADVSVIEGVRKA